MIGAIGFENHRITCILGDLPEERKHPQEILVDLRVEMDMSRCTLTDNIEDTVNYVLLAQICSELAQTNQYNLLETFAADIIETVFANFAVGFVWVRVKKPLGLPTADFTLAELSKKRGH